MAALIPFFPPEASAMAGRVDRLFFALLAVTGTVALVIAVLIVVFAVRYRERGPGPLPDQKEGAAWLEIAWTLLPLVVGLGIFVWAARLYIDMSYPPRDAMDIFVVAKQWMWQIQYPGGQHEVNSMHVPVGRPVKLTMISQDVIHSFFVPAFRMKADVRPDRYSVAWFKATRVGRYHLFCAEYCGTSHAQMGGWVEVMEPADFAEWLAGQPTGSMAQLGEKLFYQLGCISCHRSDNLRNGPVLEGLYGQEVRLADGSMVRADEDYIRESILDPAAKVVRGYQPIMPTFRGLLSEEQLQQLLAYIRHLSPEMPTQPPANETRAVPGAADRKVPGATGEGVPPVGLPGSNIPPPGSPGRGQDDKQEPGP